MSSTVMHTYKTLVGKIYNVIQLVSRREDSAEEFDDFLEHLKAALESVAHGSPHVEIVHTPAEHVVVVKDTTTKNIVIRQCTGEPIKEDEILDKDDMTNELVNDDDIEQLVREVKETDHEEEEEEEEPDVDDIPDFEEEEEKEEKEEDDEQLELVVLKGEKYFVAEESKRVYRYINNDTEGEQIGKLENGNLVPL